MNSARKIWNPGRLRILSEMLLSVSLLMFGQQVQAFQTFTSSARTAVVAPDLEQQDSRESLAERRASLRRLGDPRYFGFYNSLVRSQDILAATALQGCGPEEWAKFMVNVPAMGTDQQPTEIFTLGNLVRYLYQFGSCLTDAQKKQLLANLSKPQPLLDHGTLNQAMVQAGSWYLLAQYFPNHVWIEVGKKRTFTSAQLMAALKPMLAARTRRIFHSGHYEWLSPNYGHLNIYPLLNLADFAADSEVRTNANDEAVLEIAMLRAHSFHGVLVPPLTRNHADQRNAVDLPHSYLPAATQQVLWYYYGEPGGLGFYDFRSGLGSFFIASLGISSWLPPAAVLEMKPPQPSVPDQSVRAVTPRFTYWGDATEPEIFGDSLITDDFAIGTGNTLFDPHGYSGHVQTFSILLKSDKPHNAIECYQPFWHSADGEDGWLSDRSSPFQQMYRYDDSSVVMLFDIPKTDPWKPETPNRFWADRSSHMDALLQLATCRIARDFDEIIEEKNWVFVRHGKVFVAMATLRGSNEYDNAGGGVLLHFKIVKIREPKTALFFRVDRQRPDLNFEQFRAAVRNNLPAYDPATSSVALTEKNGSRTQVIFELRNTGKDGFWSALPRIIRDGKNVKYDATYTVQSPEMTLRDGVLTINSSAGQLVLAH